MSTPAFPLSQLPRRPRRWLRRRYVAASVLIVTSLLPQAFFVDASFGAVVAFFASLWLVGALASVFAFRLVWPRAGRLKPVLVVALVLHLIGTAAISVVKVYFSGSGERSTRASGPGWRCLQEFRSSGSAWLAVVDRCQAWNPAPTDVNGGTIAVMVPDAQAVLALASFLPLPVQKALAPHVEAALVLNIAGIAQLGVAGVPHDAFAFSADGRFVLGLGRPGVRQHRETRDVARTRISGYGAHGSFCADRRSTAGCDAAQRLWAAHTVPFVDLMPQHSKVDGPTPGRVSFAWDIENDVVYLPPQAHFVGQEQAIFFDAVSATPNGDGTWSSPCGLGPAPDGVDALHGLPRCPPEPPRG